MRNRPMATTLTDRQRSDRRHNLVVLSVIAAILIAFFGAYIPFIGEFPLIPPIVRDFRLQAEFDFEGHSYTATGSMHCTYRRARIFSTTNNSLLSGAIRKGYRTTTVRDSPSVILQDGVGAVVFRHGDLCPALQDIDVIREDYAKHGTPHAYFFPDRNKPKVIWELDVRLPAHQPRGRLQLNSYAMIPVDEQQPLPLKEDVPAAWHLYEQKKMRSRSGTFQLGDKDVWFGLAACVVTEDAARPWPEFSKAAEDVAETRVVTIQKPGTNYPRSCLEPLESHVGLMPSDDYSKAVLDLDRADLRWASVLTPYVAGYRGKDTHRWAPELCVAGEGCLGRRIEPPYWLYMPNRKAFVLIEATGLDAFDQANFAYRDDDL